MEYELLISKAKKYAVEQKKSVAIYQNGPEYGFCLFDLALEQGYPVRQLVLPE